MGIHEEFELMFNEATIICDRGAFIHFLIDVFENVCCIVALNHKHS